ncbi:Mitochondrial carrier protein MTM1 [Linum perenne]
MAEGKSRTLSTKRQIIQNGSVRQSFSAPPPPQIIHENLGLGERALSAAGAAFLSAIIVNPLDVVKLFADLRCSPSCSRAGLHGTVFICPPDCFQYKGTLDVFYKIIRQEGFRMLWRGTNAALALSVPTVGIYLPLYDVFGIWLEEKTSQTIPGATPYMPFVGGALARSLACVTCYPVELARTRMQAFKATENGMKAPGVWKTLLEVLTNVQSTDTSPNNWRGYRMLWTGMGAQLARDVPFSGICWALLEPMRRRFLSMVGDDSSVAGVLGANFSSGFIAGSVAAATTCPLDVAKTRRQIEKDPVRALNMTTRQTLMEVWRDGKLRTLFTGVGARVGRVGPSVGIVVSFYEVVKYALHSRYEAT